MKILKITCAMLLGIMCIGCASVPQQKLDQVAKSKIRTIVLLDVENPKQNIVFNVGGVGMAFGAIGALFDANGQLTKTGKFTKSVQESNIRLGDSLESALKNSLQKSGYKVTVLDGVRPEITENKEADYSKIETDADAILDVGYHVSGYISPRFSLDYKPWVRVVARLISPKDKSVLFFQVFDYGEGFGSEENIIAYPQVGDHAFRSFELLMENSNDAHEALVDGIPVISMGVAEQL